MISAFFSYSRIMQDASFDVRVGLLAVGAGDDQLTAEEHSHLVSENDRLTKRDAAREVQSG